MKKLIGVLVLAAAVAELPLAAQAHHSFAAEFDANKQVKVSGTVTKVQWRNPHTYFFVDVDDGKGATHNWAFELGSPNGLMRQGWTRESLKVGEVIQVEGARARDNSYKGNAKSITLPGGKRLFNGANEDETAAK